MQQARENLHARWNGFHQLSGTKGADQETSGDTKEKRSRHSHQIKRHSRQMKRCSCLCQQSSALKMAWRFGTAEESFLVHAQADLHRGVSASI